MAISNIFIKKNENGITLRHSYKDYRIFYNVKRPHQSLEYMTRKVFLNKVYRKIRFCYKNRT